MEVSHVRDHVTHATISGNQAIDFGISDSPEFFHILSSTLYSDQPLAVARETLCNGWDAHIEAGCVNKPIEITLTDEELVIRDFGKGIARTLIGTTYGIYGGSSKKKNLLVTGGFGLGCKAPFAYTDHFEVTSWHDGEKTIYNMSKSSAEVNGRPGIIPIASFPTTETGLQVRIQLKSSADRHRFEKLIRRIVSNGEMSATLNGDPIDVLPFSTMQHGFMVTRLPVIDTIHRMLIRYGHVIYPVENHSEYGREHSRIVRMLDRLPGQFGAYRIIFQAKPNSISVTPSRESLSMQEHTLKTLTGIFQQFDQLTLSRLQTETLNVVQESIVNAWMRMEPGELFSTNRHVPGLTRHTFSEERENNAILFDLPAIARAQICEQYPDNAEFRFKDLLIRVNSLIDAGFGNTGLIKSYRSEMLRLHRRRKPARGNVRHKTTYFSSEPSTWLHRKVIAPLISDLKAAKMRPSRLSIYGPGMNFTEATKYAPTALEHQLPFLRNIVVLTHNREGVEYRVDRFPVMKHWLGRGANLLVYTVPRSSKKQTDEAREFFKARNVELIDLTVYHSWEQAPEPVVIIKEEKPVRRPKGLPILTSLLNGGIRMDFLDDPDEDHDIQRTEKPEVIVKLPRGGDECPQITDWGYYGTKAICALWPNDIAVAISSTQVEKAIKGGAVELTPWVVERVCAEIRNNKRIQKALSIDYRRLKHIDDYYHQNISGVLSAVFSDPVLRKSLGFEATLGETDQHFLNLWQQIIGSWPDWQCKADPKIKETMEFVKNIKVSSKLIKIYEQLKKNRTILDIFDISEVKDLLSQAKVAKDDSNLEQMINTTRKIMLLTLKG